MQAHVIPPSCSFIAGVSVFVFAVVHCDRASELPLVLGFVPNPNLRLLRSNLRYEP